MNRKPAIIIASLAMLLGFTAACDSKDSEPRSTKITVTATPTQEATPAVVETPEPEPTEEPEPELDPDTAWVLAVGDEIPKLLTRVGTLSGEAGDDLAEYDVEGASGKAHKVAGLFERMLVIATVPEANDSAIATRSIATFEQCAEAWNASGDALIIIDTVAMDAASEQLDTCSANLDTITSMMDAATT